MTSSRPYLIRALYQWIVDNGVTPYILVDAHYAGVIVPVQYVQDGKIVLNIAPVAVRSLILGDEHISFNARFGGNAMDLHIPVASVLAIYARENGQGMMFNEEPHEPEPPTSPDSGGDSTVQSIKPKLRVVK